MASDFNALLRDIHRLRRHIRELKNEVANLPRVKKAHEAKVAKQEKALKDAQDLLKKLKSTNNDREVSLKSTHQQLQKYEKQLNDMTTPKEVAAKQTEIAAAKTHIGELEEQILVGMTEIDDQTPKIPPLEEALKKAKAEFATFESEFKEREERLQREAKLATEELKKQEPLIPAAHRPQYDAIIKAFDADALAGVKERDRVCGNCLTAITVQAITELMKFHFVTCGNCGRMLYLES
jgi:predicted  nucleic acid-binding Zn-ribbon protein